MFYQLCYIDEPEVQRLVHDNDGQVCFSIHLLLLLTLLYSAAFLFYCRDWIGGHCRD